MNEAVTSAPNRIMWSKKFLVLWSGGLDSTWSLYTLLRKSRAEVFVHHVNKRSRIDGGGDISLGFQYEQAAVHKMLPWFHQNCRPFAFSESYVDLTAFSSFARDMTTSLFMGAQAAMSWKFGPNDAIVTGLNGSEDGGNATDAASQQRGVFRRMLNQSTVQSVMQRSETPEVISLMPAPTREQQLIDLPMDLVAITASCREPILLETESFKPCNQCMSCRAINEAKERVAAEVDRSVV